MRKFLMKFISIGLVILFTFSSGSLQAFASSGKPALKKDSTGAEVKKLQSDLKKLGFFQSQPTGYFGSATEAAVKKFQKKYGLPVTGVAAALTFKKIDALLKPAAPKKKETVKAVSKKTPKKPDGLKLGDINPAVLKLQNDLTLLGYINVSPTGNFGSITESALIQFQKNYGLDPSGVAEARTLAVIERLVKQNDSNSRGDADRGGNDRTSVKPLYEVELQWIPGLPQTPFLKGVGKYEGVVIHYTGSPGDTAQLEADYEKKHWSRAFVHEFIDPREIIQVANPDYKAWGAGIHANDRFIHLELCDSGNQTDFEQSFSMITQRAAEYLYARQLGVTPAKADGTGTLWAHIDVTRYLGGTNHSDPIAYLKKWGKTWDDVISTVSAKYNDLAMGKKSTEDTDTTADSSTDPASGDTGPADNSSSVNNNTDNADSSNTAVSEDAEVNPNSVN